MSDHPPLNSSAAAAVVALLDSQRLMSLAVNRPDGWPQVTTVGYVNEGLNLYFMVARDSQKHANIARDSRVSIAVRSESDQGGAVGVSLAGRAIEVLDPQRVQHLNQMVTERYPGVSLYAPGGASVALYHVAPRIVSPVAVTGGRSRAQTYALGDALPTHEFTPHGEISHLI
jgi:nitroimidazol reductase NimA-like FMN-containing flavoprotein (pyridoxamine 5'-phosphate oxidase superfamily)